MAGTKEWSRALFRRLLRLYPRSFHEWYGADLESDFADLVRERGPRAAWTRVIGNLLRSLRVSHSTASRERRRVNRLTLGETGDTSMGTLLFDIRYALRGLARRPCSRWLHSGRWPWALARTASSVDCAMASALHRRQRTCRHTRKRFASSIRRVCSKPSPPRSRSPRFPTSTMCRGR